MDRAIFLLKHLKRLNVKLPVEIFHYPGELWEPDQRSELQRHGATIRMVSGIQKDERLWKNFQIKGLAIVQSSFQEILYLDSDNVPLRDPSYLFKSPTYLENGRAAFWPDLYKDHPSNAVWRLVGDTCTLDHWTFESGQIVVDKAGNDGLNYAALLIAAYMQSRQPMPQVRYGRELTRAQAITNSGSTCVAGTKTRSAGHSRYSIYLGHIRRSG